VDFALEYHYLNNQDEEKYKQILERAIDNVGQHMKGGEIWMKYIDFETANNHLGFMNLLCYMSIKTPQLETSQLEAK
jgi:hemerythrin